TVSIRVHPVPQPKGEFAAVLVLRPVDGGDRGAVPVPGPGTAAYGTAAEFRDRLARALRSGRPLLLAGERGCGRRHEALAALRAREAPCGVAEFEAACAGLAPDGWLRGLAEALADPARAVLLRHVADVPAQLMSAVADLVSRARARVVGTTSDDGEDSAA